VTARKRDHPSFIGINSNQLQFFLSPKKPTQNGLEKLQFALFVDASRTFTQKNGKKIDIYLSQRTNQLWLEILIESGIK